MEGIVSKAINLREMEVTGRIKVINPTQDVSASFKKRELVVTTEEQYPQHIMIEFTQAKVDDLNNFQVGEQVKVSINLRGREWVNPQGETKYFNSIQGWRIERLQQQAPAAQQMPPMPAAQAFEPAPSFNEEEHDDLPF
ncbi:MAG: DUF3127 domain-containing protein [Limnohabitans sp.]|nr:DUF3127 domain-containing protein [Limnohabitans sp.]